MITHTHPLFEQFLNLTTRLSPENLSCDGELHWKEVMKRRQKINQEWVALEAKAGFKVKEDEVWDQFIAKRELTDK